MKTKIFIAIFAALCMLTACNQCPVPDAAGKGWEEYELRGKVKQLQIKKYDAKSTLYDDGWASFRQIGDKPAKESTIDFDMQGRILSKVEGNETTNYNYDKRGRILRKEDKRVWADGSTFVDLDEYAYKGRKTTCKHFYNDELKGTVITEVNKNGDIVSKEEYNKDGKLDDATYYSYNRNGELQEKIKKSFKSDGTVTTDTTAYDGYAYSEEGWLLQRNSYDVYNGEKQCKTTTTNTYDEEGREIKVESVVDFIEYITEQEYNDRGFLARKANYEGLCGMSHNKTREVRYFYDYDPQSNYVVRRKTNDGLSIFGNAFIEHRTIVYYE